MLSFLQFGLSFSHVPGECTLCIYLSGCPLHCPGCPLPGLQTSGGERLYDKFEHILDLYSDRATCVCFFCEGDGSPDAHDELIYYIARVQRRGLYSCLYCGRDTQIEPWMRKFNFIKIGTCTGPLSAEDPQQRLYYLFAGEALDITGSYPLDSPDIIY